VAHGARGALDGERQGRECAQAAVVDGGARKMGPGGGDLAADLRWPVPAAAPAEHDADLGQLGAEPAEVGEDEDLRVLPQGIGSRTPGSGSRSPSVLLDWTGVRASRCEDHDERTWKHFEKTDESLGGREGEPGPCRSRTTG
jgi:hypothetical protein